MKYFKKYNFPVLKIALTCPCDCFCFSFTEKFKFSYLFLITLVKKNPLKVQFCMMTKSNDCVKFWCTIYIIIKRIVRERVREREMERAYHFLQIKSAPMQEKDTNIDDTPIIIHILPPKNSANFSFKSFSVVSPFM